jgi:hypothetical protein
MTDSAAKDEPSQRRDEMPPTRTADLQSQIMELVCDQLGLPPTSDLRSLHDDNIGVVVSLLSGKLQDPLLEAVLLTLSHGRYGSLNVPDVGAVLEADTDPRGALSAFVQRSSDELGRAALVARIAAILGACPLCCGEDATCLSCRGSGKPGSTAPLATLRDWIQPALDKLPV